MFAVGSSSGRQGGYKDRLQGDEDLTEGGLFHQFLQHFEVYTHAEGAAVPIHLHNSTQHGLNASKRKTNFRTNCFKNEWLRGKLRNTKD